MPPETEELDRPVLTLGAGPRSVQDARRWVASVLEDLGRPDLVETSTLAVSELVTNALLHARPPYQVAVRGTREHPRIEVSDGSVEPPEPPRPVDPDDLDKLLTTFGRGLGIVATASLAWGAEIEDDGKVLWFVPADDVGDQMSEGVINGQQPAVADPDENIIPVTIERVPVIELVAFQRHYHELRREVKLLGLAHQDTYPVAATLADLFVTLESTLRRGSNTAGREKLAAAYASGAEELDVEVTVPEGGVPEIERLIELLDLADAFCHDARLLALARTPEQREFQTWFLREVARRATGQPGTSWST